ncbi:cell division protein SepF [Fusibacter tunisiensis]|uniref:Cell division protein SepF n=1 Tax=Fusibacter tunisiensis TaxID=1008308 RepID=A0ABS2MM87_9FIRM|nr:cell division protein SepF [Fusibacter tunisiensis]MBM7560513.1 cell division inhibitor SepF [Fusibacter tunisiensis]
MGDKFIDKIKFFWGVDTQEEDDTTEDFYDELKRKDLEDPEYAAQQGETYSDPVSTIKTSNKVLNIHSNSQLNVVLFSPKSFEESTTIVDTLKSKRPVVMNISEVDKDLARKIFDFCSGALYAIDGHIQQVSKGIFVMAPQNVDITGDVMLKKDHSEPASWLRE